jgi:hypothetical protein
MTTNFLLRAAVALASMSILPIELDFSNLAFAQEKPVA